MPAIRTDNDSGMLVERAAGLRMPSDAGDAPVFKEHLVDDEAFTDFGAGFGRGVDEQLVQDGPPRTVHQPASAVPGLPES